MAAQVNKRVADEEFKDHSGDPFFPKTQWPTPELCPLCRAPSVTGGAGKGGSEAEPEWNEDEVGGTSMGHEPVSAALLSKAPLCSRLYHSILYSEMPLTLQGRSELIRSVSRRCTASWCASMAMRARRWMLLRRPTLVAGAWLVLWHPLASLCLPQHLTIYFPCQTALLAQFRDCQRTLRCPSLAPFQACQPPFRRKGLSGKVEKARRHRGTIAKAGGIALVALAAYVLVRNARGSGRKGASIL